VSDMRWVELERLLENTIGLEVASVGPETISAAIRRRLRVVGLSQEAAYLRKVLSSPEELQALIDAVVIPETWFFRDGSPFALLGEFAVAVWRGKRATMPLRVLSAPCATGEEAYSIAITLFEAGLPPGGFVVHAIDISRESLRRAERGSFGRNAFRTFDPTCQAAHFNRSGNEFSVRPLLRAAVHFAHGNLMNARFLAGEAPFDAIFCRNLLIYLTRAGRQRVIGTLDRLLAVGGMLVVGHAEMIPELTAHFQPSPQPGTFAYRKGKDVSAQTETAARVPRHASPRFRSGGRP